MYRRIALSAVCFLALRAHAQTLALDGTPKSPFASSANVRVFVFVRTDCPITNRYAPELQRLAREFKSAPVDFWLVYEDSSDDAAAIRKQIADYNFPGTPLRDTHHELSKRAHAVISPEAAVFDNQGKLEYHGRIDDRYVDFGKARPEAQHHDLENAITDVLAGKPVAESETRAVGCSLADVS